MYLRVDHMPYYLYGGSEENYAKDVEAIMKFISDNIRYPKDAWKIEKQGKVICRFVVEKDGRLSDIHILEGDSLYPSLDKEAIRVISSFPKWHPGTMGKKAVRTGFSFPSFSVCGERKYRSDILYPRTVKVAIFMTNPNGLIVYYRFFNNETYYLGIVVSSGFSCNRKGFLP